MDTVKTQIAAKQSIAYAQRLGPVFFEGILISTIFGPWLQFSQDHGGMIWGFLDTPLETCLERIQIRNGGKPINEKLVEQKVRTIDRVYDKAVEAGETTASIDGSNAEHAAQHISQIMRYSYE